MHLNQIWRLHQNYVISASTKYFHVRKQSKYSINTLAINNLQINNFNKIWHLHQNCIFIKITHFAVIFFWHKRSCNLHYFMSHFKWQLNTFPQPHSYKVSIINNNNYTCLLPISSFFFCRFYCHIKHDNRKLLQNHRYLLLLQH